MPSVGALIWISCRPLIRLYVSKFWKNSRGVFPDLWPFTTFFFRVFCVACGFTITKADIFPTVAARGAGQIVLNITIPCLMFSKIVPAFNPDNARALGLLLPLFFPFLWSYTGMNRSPRAYRPLVWSHRCGARMDYQAIFLGSTPVQVWNIGRRRLGECRWYPWVDRSRTSLGAHSFFLFFCWFGIAHV